MEEILLIIIIIIILMIIIIVTIISLKEFQRKEAEMELQWQIYSREMHK